MDAEKWIADVIYDKSHKLRRKLRLDAPLTCCLFGCILCEGETRLQQGNKMNVKKNAADSF